MRLLIAALALSATAAAPDPLRQPRDAAGVARTEALWVAALDRRDGATVARILADDFVDTSWRGALRRKAEMIDSAKVARSTRNEISELTVQMVGHVAIARGRNTIRGRDGEVAARVRLTDVFRYERGRWRAIAAQETPERAESPGGQP